ncbi:unnamed protein product [Linum tenue]|uniref:F-box domain-containing protein n=1 Tax=Linum tenue TaxID=586396 RepID=A0AAV0MVF9_9ROSI|nr:unnamed protein product [Linum tenue]
MATQNCNSVLPCSSEKLGDDDLLAEVLIRVPDPKSAYRCKPVCKRWNSLISDPSFNRRFVSHSQSRHERNDPPPPLLLPSDDPESIVSSFLPMPEEATPPRSFRVFDSFKDLILCGFLDRENNVDDLSFVGSLFVCNPFTKQWIALPLGVRNAVV